jgi:uncharacterized membrane protein
MEQYRASQAEVQVNCPGRRTATPSRVREYGARGDDRRLTRRGAGWGGLFGGLIGALIAAPFTSGASAAAALAAGSLSGVALGATVGAIDAESWKDDYGISEDFVDQVGAMIQPGDSAVFVLARTISPDLVADAFQGYGGTILRTSLSDAQRAKVEATLHGAR